MSNLISPEKADKALAPIQVTLNLDPRHFEMIRRCAKLREQSAEAWIIQSAECSLRYDREGFDDLGIDVGFDDDDVDEVYEEIFGGVE